MYYSLYIAHIYSPHCSCVYSHTQLQKYISIYSHVASAMASATQLEYGMRKYVRILYAIEISVSFVMCEKDNRNGFLL